MFRKLLFVLLLIAGAAGQGFAQQLILSPEVQLNTEMRVKGRQGWQFNQVIRFGDYATSKVKRGWTQGYDIGFTLRFRSAREKLSFTQHTPDGRSAEVLAVSRFKNTEYEMLRGFLSYSFNYENTFAGTIIPADSVGSSWEFIVYNPEGDLVDNGDCGMAKDDSGHTISIRGIRDVEGMPKWMRGANFGFEFVLDGHAVAAASTVNNGKVWMNEGVDGSTRLVISALASALLVRHDVSQAASN
jgi:hypothetical protein